MTRVPRADTTRRMFIYTADALSLSFCLYFGVLKLIALARYPGYTWYALAGGLCLTGAYAGFWRIQRAAFRGRPRIGAVAYAALLPGVEGSVLMILFNLFQMAVWTVVLTAVMAALKWLWGAAREFHAEQEARAMLAVFDSCWTPIPRDCPRSGASSWHGHCARASRTFSDTVPPRTAPSPSRRGPWRCATTA